MVSALVVIALRVYPTRTLIISQVILRFGLPVAPIPLVVFTSERGIMHEPVNRKLTTVMASVVTLIIVGLNAFLVYQLLLG